jgi:hypothetical protein
MSSVARGQAIEVCRSNIETFLERQIGRWTGLKAGCQENDITAWLPFNDGAGTAFNGNLEEEYSFRVLFHPGFQEGIEFYFAHRQLRFIATDYWSFDQQLSEKLLRELGEPPHRLPLYWRDDVIERGEWVYPEKGVALGVIPATGLIARLVVYPPCPLKRYQERYYNTRLSRERRTGDPKCPT